MLFSLFAIGAVLLNNLFSTASAHRAVRKQLVRTVGVSRGGWIDDEGWFITSSTSWLGGVARSGASRLGTGRSVA
eukprot:3696021-Rhodomonas_salina.1